MMDKQVMTLITPAPALDRELGDSITRTLTDAGARIVAIESKAKGNAQDIIFQKLEPERAEKITREIIGNAQVDIIIQEAGNRKKRLLITDMDSTVITVECIDELADFMGFKAQVAAITDRAMNGELDFSEALVARVKLLAGMEESTLQRVFDERVKFMPGAKELVQIMRENGAYCVLVSGGFTFFTSRVREALGFHADYSNTLEIAEGKLTGRVIPPILDKNVKLQTLLETCTARGISPQDALAVGDGSNDLPMLLAAGLGVAYHAKPVVREAARARLDCCDLSALIITQGY